MNVGAWVAQRRASYVGRRALALLARYRPSPEHARRRVRTCVARLAERGCAPTFPVPGRVVERYPAFFRELQDAGVEIAVHGYDHIDLAACADGAAQLTRAAEAFDAHGIERRGFRCPYLRCTPQLLEALPQGLYAYSSNRGVWWGASREAERRASVTHDVLRGFYRPLEAADHPSLPWMQAGMVEVPVSLPDDLQLHDGLGLGPEAMAAEWGRVLEETHRRGEAFVVQFHPELGAVAVEALCLLLERAASLRPPVWVARLRDVSDWWRERATDDIRVARAADGVRLAPAGSPRVTIVARGLALGGAAEPWDGRYRRVRAAELGLPGGPLPAVGLPEGAPADVVAFLREAGYVVQVGGERNDCALYVDGAVLRRCPSRRALIDHVEASAAPLVRAWPWPDGARSALCITGDLDALSLIDYTLRFVARGG